MPALRNPIALTVVLLATSAPLWFACSSDDDKKGGAVNGTGGGGNTNSIGGSTGEPSNGLDQLSEQESTQYCRDIITTYSAEFPAEEQKKYVCAGNAVLEATTRASLGGDAAQTKTICADSYSKCLIDPAENSETFLSQADCASFPVELKKCKGVTKAQVDRCNADQIVSLKKVQAATICDQFGSGGAGGGNSAASALLVSLYLQVSPPSCQVVKQKCPAANAVKGFSPNFPSPSGGGMQGSIGSAGQGGTADLPTLPSTWSRR